jgi:hypothetical protein
MEWIASAYAMDLSVSQTQTTGWAGTQSTMGSEMGGTQDSVATVQVSAEDMEAFYRAIEQKSAEFNSELQQHRSESRRQEDALQKELSEMEAEQRALEKGQYRKFMLGSVYAVCLLNGSDSILLADKERIQSERDRLRDELKRLNSQVGSQRKILKSEVSRLWEDCRFLAVSTFFLIFVFESILPFPAGLRLPRPRRKRRNTVSFGSSCPEVTCLDL